MLEMDYEAREKVFQGCVSTTFTSHLNKKKTNKKHTAMVFILDAKIFFELLTGLEYFHAQCNCNKLQKWDHFMFWIEVNFSELHSK